MGPKRTTRTSKASSISTGVEEPPELSLPRLKTKENEQRRIFILPKTLSAEARILTLSNPATASNGRYFFCPENGLFEFIKVGVPRSDFRSWLITQPHKQCYSEDGSNATTNAVSPQDSSHLDYILEHPDIFIATPIDPVFFLSPLFQSGAKSKREAFRLDDDYMDALTEASSKLASAMRLPKFRSFLLKRLRAVSEIQEFGDDVLFKPSDQRFAQLILDKGRNMTKEGAWPVSMERAFVEKQLEIPLGSIPDGNPQLLTPEQSINASDLDSQVSEHPTVQSDLADSSTPASLKPESPNVSVQVKELMRLRVALNYIASSYLPKDLRADLLDLISKNAMVDYAPLDEHLQKVQQANAQIHALRSLSDNISRKRGAIDNDEALEVRAEKKRKKEEEEKRKKAESRASKELKKVNTSGMKKLSSFFTKPTAVAKPT